MYDICDGTIAVLQHQQMTEALMYGTSIVDAGNRSNSITFVSVFVMPPPQADRQRR